MALGVTRQLVKPALAAASDAECASLLAGPPGWPHGCWLCTVWPGQLKRRSLPTHRSPCFTALLPVRQPGGREPAGGAELLDRNNFNGSNIGVSRQ
jgi:hypothetical protein